MGGMSDFCAGGPPVPLCVICPRGWLGLEESHFPTALSWQCPPRGKPTICRLNGDPVLRGLLAMHLPSVLECPNVCSSSGWDLAPQNASPGCETPWGQPLCSAPGMGSRLPRECCDPNQTQLWTLLAPLWSDPCELTAWWRAFASILLPNTRECPWPPRPVACSSSCSPDCPCSADQQPCTRASS